MEGGAAGRNLKSYKISKRFLVFYLHHIDNTESDVRVTKSRCHLNVELPQVSSLTVRHGMKDIGT